ncbi:MAG TPA: hypothetical protein VFJ16_12445 [Longimicrobium sp.]|nr:hypothetical protein [Longimicrobium sp.]
MSEQNQDPKAAELTEENLESVSGGIISGGCIPPIFTPTLPTIPDDGTVCY